jgi:hypothetical protein
MNRVRQSRHVGHPQLCAKMPKRRRDTDDSDASPPPSSKRASAAAAREESLLKKWAVAHAVGDLQRGIDAFNARTVKPPNGPIRNDGSIQPLRFLESREDGDVVVVTDCVKCGVRKPLLPRNFAVANGGKSLETCVAGTESFRNSAAYPCLVCFAAMAAERDATVDGRVRLAGAHYPGVGVDGFWTMWRRQGGIVVSSGGQTSIVEAARCAVLQLPLNLGGRGIAEWFAPSVNNLSAEHKKPEDHVVEHCELTCAEVNVSQHDAIPCLKEAWRALIEDAARAMEQSLTPDGRAALEAETRAASAEVETNWANRKHKTRNGVTVSQVEDKAAYYRQCSDLDVACITGYAASHHRQHDTRRFRLKTTPPDQLTQEEMVDKWITAPRCAHSGVLLTIRNGPRRVSMDRVDNAVHHTAANTVCACRLLNSPAGMSRAKFCATMLRQGVVRLKPVVRLAYASELVRLGARRT